MEKTVDKKRISINIRQRIDMLPVAVIVMIVVFTILRPQFLTPENLKNVMFQASILGLVAFGQLFCLLSGGIDFSVSAQMAFAAIVGSLVMVQYGILTGIIAALIATMCCGGVIGFVVAKFKANAMMVSLGMFWMLKGITMTLSNGQTIYNLPVAFSFMGNGRILGMPITFLWLLIAFAICYVLLNHTVYGKSLYALGGNVRFARLSGIPVDRYRIVAYVICSCFSAIAGLTMTSSLGAGYPSQGADIMMQNFVVVFIAGVRWGGGEGKLGNVCWGIALITLLANGLNLINVSSFAQQAINGIILIVAIIADTIRKKGTGWNLRDLFSVKA